MTWCRGSCVSLVQSAGSPFRIASKGFWMDQRRSFSMEGKAHLLVGNVLLFEDNTLSEEYRGD